MFATPFIVAKNALQERRPIWAGDFPPRSLYRGGLLNVAATAPVNACQFAGAAGFKWLVPNKDERELTLLERLAPGFVGGAAGALVATPTELVILHQQKYGGELRPTAINIWRRFGFSGLFKGTVLTAGRDGVFTAFYMGLLPSAKDQLRERLPGWPSWVLTFVVGVPTGMASCVLTHPLDTVKTRMQVGSNWLRSSRHAID
eukprot:scaffold384_cov188-Prasinococcus_capsulatus_cf.AAC.1